MRGNRSARRIAVLSGLTTAFFLVAPLAATVLISLVLEKLPPLSSANDGLGIAIVVGLGLLCGWLWGGTMARLTGAGRERWMRLAGALALAPAFILNVLLLVALDDQGVLRKVGFSDLPIRNQYTLIFVWSAFFVAFVAALALGLVATNWRRAVRIAVLTGLGTAIMYLLVNVGMDLIGFRVGGPRSGLSLTLAPMPTVTITGTIVASLIGGAIGGLLLSRIHNMAEEGPV